MTPILIPCASENWLLRTTFIDLIDRKGMRKPFQRFHRICIETAHVKAFRECADGVIDSVWA